MARYKARVVDAITARVGRLGDQQAVAFAQEKLWDNRCGDIGGLPCWDAPQGGDCECGQPSFGTLWLHAVFCDLSRLLHTLHVAGIEDWAVAVQTTHGVPLITGIFLAVFVGWNAFWCMNFGWRAGAVFGIMSYFSIRTMGIAVRRGRLRAKFAGNAEVASRHFCADFWLVLCCWQRVLIADAWMVDRAMGVRTRGGLQPWFEQLDTSTSSPQSLSPQQLGMEAGVGIGVNPHSAPSTGVVALQADSSNTPVVTGQPLTGSAAAAFDAQFPPDPKSQLRGKE